MATYNGWTIIPMPTVPAAPQTIDFTITQLVAVSQSPFTGQQQIQDWRQGYLEASVSMPPLTHVQAQEWIAFLMSLQGPANIFQMGDPLARVPQGTAGGSPVVHGDSQQGFALITGGWPASTTVLRPGDWIQIGFRMYRNLTSATTDGSGQATLSIWPRLRETPPDGDPILTSNTQGLWRLKNTSNKWSETEARVYGIQFDIREAI